MAELLNAVDVDGSAVVIFDPQEEIHKHRWIRDLDRRPIVGRRKLVPRISTESNQRRFTVTTVAKLRRSRGPPRVIEIYRAPRVSLIGTVIEKLPFMTCRHVGHRLLNFWATAIKRGLCCPGTWSAAGEARVAAIEGVVDRVRVGRHRQRRVVRHRTTVAVEYRRDDIRIHPVRFKTPNHRRSQTGKMVIYQVRLIRFPRGRLAEDVAPARAL